MRLLILAAVLAGARKAGAQETGTVGGVVVNTWDGTPLPLVVVTVRGTTLATQTDATGRYELKNVPPGDQVMRFSKSGFASAVVTDVRVLPGQTTAVNGNLRPEFYEMEEYQVTAELFTEQTEKILIERQQASSLVDAVGSEQFSKLGAADAGQIVARVTGVSVVGGKYVVVRGLSDRYTRTLFNGVEVPSADPYRTSPQLDLFPSAMIDRVSISKTFTPDQPGGTGGGTIDIITKSFPEKPFLKATVGTSYNPNSNLKDNFLADSKSSMSIVAFPSGPKPLRPDLFELTSAPKQQYPQATSRDRDPAIRELRLQEANAVAGLLQELGVADFAGVNKSSPLNSSFSASSGRTIPVFGNNLGLFAGINYNRAFKLIEDATVNRFASTGAPDLLGRETRGNINTDYGANVNVGYDLSKYAQLGFNFMLARSIDEEARHASSDFVEGREDTTLERWQMHHTDREILNYQLNGHHDIPILAEAKLDWALSLANTTQDEPDNRFMNYYLTAGQPQFGDASLPSPQFPARYFREIEEQSLNARADWTQPLAFMKHDTKLKAGFYNSTSDRDFREQYFAYEGHDGFDPGNPNSYLNDPALLLYTTSPPPNPLTPGTNYNFSRFVRETFAHPYTASSDVKAGYLMGDFGVFSWLRLIGGARLERTLITLDTPTEHSAINQTDLLPAAGAVITIINKLDLRLGYGETVARPSFRELAPIANFLPDLNVIAFGNRDLQMSAITSYDLRLEWFPAPGDLISAGVFYKQLDRPIELYSITLSDDIVTWSNRLSGKVMGIEFEARKSLGFLTPHFRNFTIGANITLIKSETDLTADEVSSKANAEPNPSTSRPLYDQSPYIINVDLTYQNPKSGTSFSIGANMTGPRIVLAKAIGPDLYEHPPISFDASISQRLYKSLSMRFAVRNILDPDFRYTYGSSYDGNIFQSFKRGRTFALSLTAEF